MSGWPTRISRNALGPKLANARPVKNPTTDAGADMLNLAWWTLSGSAVAGSVAWLLATFTGPSSIVVTAHGEAWAPNGDGAAPGIVRSSQGLYVVTYAASYLDMDGIAVQTKLWGGLPMPQDTADRRAVASVSSNRIVTVTIRDGAGAVADASFLLLLL